MPSPDAPRHVVVETRVRFSETDRFGIAHHSNYVNWFEVGRVELLRLLGRDYDALEQEGFAFPLVELGFRYDAPVRLDERIRIEATFLSVAPYRLVFACRIHGEAPPLRARAFSVHAFVDRELKLCEIPADLRAIVEANLAPAGYLGRRFGPETSRGRR